MSAYTDTMDTILGDWFEEGTHVVVENGDSAYEYAVNSCECCPYARPDETCSYEGQLYFRQEDGGIKEDGKCYTQDSVEEFWDLFSSLCTVDPETGEVFDI